MTELLLVGVITGARGIKGELRIKAFTANPDDVCSYGPLFNEDGNKSWTVKQTGNAKGQVLARFKGVDDRTEADTMKGVKLYIPHHALPDAGEEEYYYSDLIGLKVELMDGTELGTVKAVMDAGAGASLEVQTPDGDILVPFTRLSVPVVNITDGKVIIDPPDGLMDPPPAEAQDSSSRNEV